MKLNVGGIESVVRIFIGVVLLYGALYGYIGWYGLVGIIVLATGLGRFCPLKALLKINSNDGEEGAHH